MDKTPCRGSHFADRTAAQQALHLTLPMIEPAMADPQVSGAGFLYLVVMDPALTPADCRYEDAVLLEHAVGDRARWDADYAAFAHAKARLSWQAQRDSAALQSLQPHRLREGDSLLWGSVCLEGIVVAASGCFPWFDEAFATALAANLRAIAKQRQAAALDKRQLAAGR